MLQRKDPKLEWIVQNSLRDAAVFERIKIDACSFIWHRGLFECFIGCTVF